MKSSRTLRAAISLGSVSALLLLMVLALLTYHGGDSGLLGFFVRNHVSVMILLVLVSIATGAVMVLMLSAENAQQHKAALGATDLLLTFLSADERVVVEQLIRNDGSALQSQLASSAGFSAVRMHRLIGRLASKRFITLERYGKTNKVFLAPELRIVSLKDKAIS